MRSIPSPFCGFHATKPKLPWSTLRGNHLRAWAGQGDSEDKEPYSFGGRWWVMVLSIEKMDLATPKIHLRCLGTSWKGAHEKCKLFYSDTHSDH